jgi:hypothetical protein
MSLNFATNGTQKYGANVAYVHFFSDATHNISLNSTSSSYPISTVFAKKYADTDLLLWGITPVSGQNAYQAGEFAAISNGDTSGSNYHRKYDAAHYISPFNGMGDDGIYGTVHWHAYWNASSLAGLNSAGNKTLFLGWSTRGGSSESPGNIWNPSERAGRIRDRTTNIQIWEIKGNATVIT